MSTFHWEPNGRNYIGYIVSRHLKTNLGYPRWDEFAKITRRKDAYSELEYWYGTLTMRGDVPDSSKSYKIEYLEELKKFLEGKQLWQKEVVKRKKTLGEDPRYAWMFRGWGYPPAYPLTIEDIRAAQAMIPKHSDS